MGAAQLAELLRADAGRLAALRETVRDALADGPLTRDELGAAITARPKFRHLGFAFADRAGHIAEAARVAGRHELRSAAGRPATFQRLDGNPRWAGVPDLDEAGTRAVEAYFRTYGPATPDHVHYWLGDGLGAGRKRIRSWIAGLGDRLTEVEIDGELRVRPARGCSTTWPRRRPTTAVRLLPGYDQWVLGPGTADAHVVPPARRSLVSRQANLVIAGGVVSGTWSVTDDQLVTAWFADAGPPPAGRACGRGRATRPRSSAAPSNRPSGRSLDKPRRIVPPLVHRPRTWDQFLATHLPTSRAARPATRPRCWRRHTRGS